MHESPTLVAGLGDVAVMGETVEPPHRDGVAGACIRHRVTQAGPVGLGPAVVVFEETLAAGPGERIGLQVQILIVGVKVAVTTESTLTEIT